MGRGSRHSSRHSSRPNGGASSSSRIVQRLYAQQMCLKDAVAYLARGIEGMAQLLVRPSDTQAYADTFLLKTMVAFESEPPARQQAWRLSQRFSQEQVSAVACMGRSTAAVC
jgi:hypothetical protein